MSSRSSKFHSQLGRAETLAVVVSAGLIFTGCDSGGDPGASPSASAPATPTSSASVTPTPSPTIAAVYKPADASGPAQNVPVPVLPDVAKTKTKEGLEAFVKYYVGLLQYAYQSGDTALLDKVNSPSCSSCSGPIGDIHNAYESGGWVVGGEVEATAVSTGFLSSPEGFYFAILSIRQAKITYYSGVNNPRVELPAPPAEAGMQLTASFESEKWIVQSFSPPQGL